VFTKIALTAVLIVLALVALRNGSILRRTGLLGSCEVYATASSGQQWEICRPGSLDGAPDLSGNGCISQQSVGRVQYWYCPAPVVSTPAGGV
jgi:hypothetical protein